MFECDERSRGEGLHTNSEVLRKESRCNEIGEDKTLFAIASGTNFSPTPPAPLFTIRARRLLGSEKIKAPDAKPVAVKIRAQENLM